MTPDMILEAFASESRRLSEVVTLIAKLAGRRRVLPAEAQLIRSLGTERLILG